MRPCPWVFLPLWSTFSLKRTERPLCVSISVTHRFHRHQFDNSPWPYPAQQLESRRLVGRPLLPHRPSKPMTPEQCRSSRRRLPSRRPEGANHQDGRRAAAWPPSTPVSLGPHPLCLYRTPQVCVPKNQQQLNAVVPARASLRARSNLADYPLERGHSPYRAGARVDVHPEADPTILHRPPADGSSTDQS